MRHCTESITHQLVDTILAFHSGIIEPVVQSLQVEDPLTEILFLEAILILLEDLGGDLDDFEGVALFTVGAAHGLNISYILRIAQVERHLL